MPITDLARATMTSAIMRYYTISLRQEEEHLVVPIISAQGPSVMENNRLGVLWAPVLEKNRHAVFCDDISMTVTEFRSGRFLAEFAEAGPNVAPAAARPRVPDMTARRVAVIDSCSILYSYMQSKLHFLNFMS